MKIKHNFDNSKYCYADGTALESTPYKQHKSTRYKNYFAGLSKFEMKRIPQLYQNIYECCGCSACEAVCPGNAINMEADEEGFLYPVIDLSKCIGCYQCERVCVFK